MLPALPLYTCMNKADKSASNSLNPSIFEGLVTLCAPDAVCFSRHVPHASGRILAERFYVIGTLRSNFLLHKKDPPAITGIEIFFISSLLTGLYRSQNFSGVIDPFFGWRSDAFQRIRNSQLFPLKYTECMVRKHFDSLHCF